MPSLSELKQFKTSFHVIGKEKADLEAKKIPFDDLKLPDTEPDLSVLEAKANEAQNQNVDEDDEFGFESTDEDESTETESDISPIDDLDFDAFLDSQPDDLPDIEEDDVFDTTTPVAETPDVEDFSAEQPELPGTLVPHFPEELDTAVPDEDTPVSDIDDLDGPGFPSEPSPAVSDENLNFDNLDDFGLPDEQAATSTEEDLSLDDLGGIGLPDEQAVAGTEEDLNLDDLGGFDQPDEQAATGTDEDLSLDDLDSLGGFDQPDAPAATGTDEVLNLDDLGGFGQPDEQAATGAGEDLNLDDLGGFDASDEQVPSDGGEGLDLGNLDDFNFGDDAATPSFDGDENESDDLGTDSETETEAAPSSDSGGMDDFSFPDIDSILKESQKSSMPDLSTKETKAKRRGKAKPEKEFKPPENVDEIKLSQAELDRLQKTLSGYPLNLRIACEEIIAEQVVEPEKLSKLITHLVNGSPAKETALLAGHILGKIITIPKGFEKSSGEALEAEQRSFAYIFVHNFLPILRLLAIIGVLVVSLFFLIYTFIYLPGKAESLYKQGYERIFAGEYQQANVRFDQAFETHRKKDWFYKYAEAFRDERQYIYAEQKYDDLLRYYLRDKKGVLDYAHLETYYLRNYDKADKLLRRQLLDYAPNDYDGLLAVGDNSLAWGEVDPSKYEDARYAYARVMEKYGWKDPVVERMMQYFIRTDDLGQVLNLRQWFDENKKRKMTPNTLAELGGYFLDKQLEEVRGVPNEYLEYIDRVRDLLQEAIKGNPDLPESYYHLARYYNRLDGVAEERGALEYAIQAFDKAPEESVRRLNYRIDTHQRYADLLINNGEFFPAEEQLIRGINLYEDAILRRLMTRSPQYGRLYSGLGDLEYYKKLGDMEASLRFYRRAEQNGYAPPEMQYRMGAAYYRLEDWRNALEYFFAASSSLPLNDRILFALGNTTLKRGDYFAANGYYTRLINILEGQRVRLPSLLPSDRPLYRELADRLMEARNNAGVACEMLAAQTGNRSYHTRAMALYAEAERAWDARTRDPNTMIRSSHIPLPYLNLRNALYPNADYEPQIFIFIDREASENSPWVKLAPLALLDNSRGN
jgi:TolA-binding protein